MEYSPIVIAVLISSLFLSAFFIYIALWSRHRKAGVGTLNLLGMQAYAKTAMEPDGAIILDGELWRARVRDFKTPLMPGQEVRVIGVEGHFLIVESTE